MSKTIELEKAIENLDLVIDEFAATNAKFYYKQKAKIERFMRNEYSTVKVKSHEFMSKYSLCMTEEEEARLTNQKMTRQEEGCYKQDETKGDI